MPANIELKAYLPDAEKYIDQLRTITGKEPTELIQNDLFFNVNKGRLKLRFDQEGTGELIYYCRANSCGPRLSSYFRKSIVNPKKKLMELEYLFGVKRQVTKIRLLFMLDDIRIHIDYIEGIGYYLEIEVPIVSQRNINQASASIAHLIDKIGLKSTQFVGEAYADVLAKQ